MDLHANSLMELLKLGRSVSEGPVRLAPRIEGLEISVGEQPGHGFKALLPWRGSPPSRLGNVYSLPKAFLDGLLEVLDREVSISLRIADDLLQLWTPARSFQASRVGPRFDTAPPELLATVRMEARVANHLSLALRAALRSAGEGPTRVVLTLTPAVGNLCLLVGTEALTSLSLGPGADVAAELEASGRCQSTTRSAGLEDLLLEAEEQDVILSIASDGALVLRGRSYAGAWEAIWPAETTATEARPPSPVPSPTPPPVATVARSAEALPPAALPSPASAVPVAAACTPARGPGTQGRTSATPSGPPAATEPVTLDLRDPANRSGAWNGPWAEAMAEAWTQRGWSPASSPASWRAVVEHWSRVLGHLRERWPDLPEPPWEGWDREKARPAQLPRLLLDPRVLLAHVVTDPSPPLGLLLQLEDLLQGMAKEGSFADFVALGSPSGTGTASLREFANVGLGCWRSDDLRPYLEVPGEVLRALRQALAEEDALLWAGRLANPSVPETSRVDAGPHLPLALLLAMASRGEIRVTQSGDLYKASAVRLQQGLMLPSPEFAEVLHHIAVDLGFVHVTEGFLRPADGVVERFQATSEQFREGWLAWLLSEVGPTARAVLYTLDEAAPRAWTTTSALGLALRRRAPRFRGARKGGPVVDPSSEAILPTVLSVLFLGGLLEVSGTGPFREARLTEIGRRTVLAGDRGASPPQSPDASAPAPSSATFHVLPDFEIAVPSEHLAPADAWILAQSAELISSDHVTRFRLTRGRISDAAREGLGGDRLLSLLRGRSPRPVPGNVAQAIVEWGPAAPQPEVRQDVALLGAPPDGTESGGERVASTLDSLKGRMPRGRRVPGRFRRLGEGPNSWGQLLLSPEEIEGLRAELEEHRYGRGPPKGLEELWEFVGAELPESRGPPRKPPAPTLDQLGGVGLPPRIVGVGPPAPPRLSSPPQPRKSPVTNGLPFTAVERTLADMVREGRDVVVKRQVRGTSSLETAAITPYCLVEGPGAVRYLVAGDHRTGNLQLLRTSRFVEVGEGRRGTLRRSPSEVEDFLEGLAGPFTMIEAGALGPPGAHRRTSRTRLLT